MAALSRWVRPAALIAVGVLIGRLFGGDAAAPAAAAPAAATDDLVRIAGPLAERAGIAVEAVKVQPLSPSIRLAGTVAFEPDRVADIGGRIPGRVTKILVRPGDTVRAGQAVAEIESAELGDAVGDYLAVLAHSVAADQQLKREEELAGQQLSSRRALEEAQARAKAEAAALRGAEQRLIAIGMSQNDIKGLAKAPAAARTVVLRTPISGRVIERFAVVGQTVEPTANILRVGDLSEVWVLLDIFERDLARVAKGDHAEIVSESHPGRVFKGRVSDIGAVIDERTRTAHVRIAVDNDGWALRVGQFVTAAVESGGAAPRRALTAPRSAVVQIGGNPSVFVEIEPLAYELRAVQLGLVDGDHVEVSAGLNENERVVTTGTFALKSELAR